MKKILLVFGTRPEAIKMCPLVLELKKRPLFDVKVLVTGQHREMLDQILEYFMVKPDYDLNIMQKGQTLSDITSKILLGMQSILYETAPELVLVHGDTTTSFAAALACFYTGIKVGHVEAGLRTYDLQAPFPEEYNRQTVDIISEFCFSPTEQSKQNLLKEKKAEKNIYVTGNTGIDALKHTIYKEYENPNLSWCEGSRLILLTAHRRENWGDPLKNIFKAVRYIVEKYPDIKVLYPVHRNPIVSDIAKEELGDCDRIRLIEPLDVIDFHNIMNASYLIMTDSGGIQEEAPSLGKPVLVLRDTTERPEGIEAGTLKLVGTNYVDIIRETEILLTNNEEYKKMANAVNPYGDGTASELIADILTELL